jgi:N-acetylneuraminic acid mutarotase
MTSTKCTLSPVLHSLTPPKTPPANAGATRQRSMIRRLRLFAMLFSLSLALMGPDSSSAQCDWGQVAQMSTARQTLGAAKGGDGLIYAVGGDSSSGNTVEALNPQTRQWSSVPSFPTPRAAFAVTAGKDGKIYVIGGVNNNGKSSVVEVYNPATQAWSRLTDMPTPRMYLAAATGADGRIYAMGGIGTSGDVNTVEVYNPTSATWATAAPMQFTHSYFAAAASTDGRIYSIGGINNSDPNTASAPVVEAYVPGTNSWSTVSPMINGRFGFAAVSAADKRIYVFGGEGPLASVEAYDPVNDVWNNMLPLPAAVGDEGAATGVDGRIYVLGGNLNGSFSGSSTAQTYSSGFNWFPAPSMPTDLNSNEPNFNGSRVETGAALGKDGNLYVLGGNDGNAALTEAQSYSSTSGKWTVLPAMNELREKLAAAAGHDGLIYAIGGQNGNNPSLATVEAFNPSSSTWSERATLLTPRFADGAATGADGRIYAIGGAFIDSGFNQHILSSGEVYDPLANKWSAIPPMSTAREQLAMTAGSDGRIYAFGGDDGTNTLNTAEAYNTKTKTWTALAPMPNPRRGHAVATGADNLIYVFGGLAPTLDRVVDIYNPVTNTWMPSECMVTQRYTVSAATGHDGRIYAFGGSDGSGNILASVEARNKPVVLAKLTITPAVVVGGESAVGTVTLSHPAPPTGLVVTLASTLSAAKVPTTVTVSPGRTTKTFAIMTGTVTSTESGKISGTVGAITKSALFTVNP